MSERIYLDYNASAPMLESVKAAMIKGLELFGNPSSVHQTGRTIRGAIEDAREQVASFLGARPQDVIWTSGGTEANNLGLTPSLFPRAMQKDIRLYVNAIEHPSVLNGMRFAPEMITVIPVTSQGQIDLSWLEDQLNEMSGDQDQAQTISPGSAPILVSCMAANNETGIVQPLAELAKIVQDAGGLLHSDCVQALGKRPLAWPELSADLISLSAHKIGGPQGVGALVLKDTSIILRDPLVAGGGQELKRRGGTENVLGIIGFGAAIAALKENQQKDQDQTTALRNELEQGLKEISPDCVIFGQDQERLPNVCCFGVPGFSAETQVIQMDLSGVSISSGSACSSGKVEQSHVLKAMGVAPDLSFAALRISLGNQTTKSDINGFLKAWQKIYEQTKASSIPGGKAA